MGMWLRGALPMFLDVQLNDDATIISTLGNDSYSFVFQMLIDHGVDSCVRWHIYRCGLFLTSLLSVFSMAVSCEIYY